MKKLKSDQAFKTISEVSEIMDVPTHVLRFWEGKFHQLEPMKRAGGRRYYRPEDIEVLKRIRDLLYKKGFTIKGAQKELRSHPKVQENVLLSSQEAVVQKEISQSSADHKLGQVLTALTLLRNNLKEAIDEA